MSVWLWVLLIHIVELVAFVVFVTFKKNAKLEKIVEQQQNHIVSLNILFSQLSENLSKVDEKIYIDGDNSLNEVFENIKNINNSINSFYN
jgi:hypothetical protein